MSESVTKGQSRPEHATAVINARSVVEQARELLAGTNRFLEGAEARSARIRVAVVVPVGLICVMGWLLLTLGGDLFTGGARYPSTMLVAGILLLLIGLHSWVYRSPNPIVTTVLATTIGSIYVTAVVINGHLPTLFLGAVIVAFHSVSSHRVALVLSLGVLALTPATLWLSLAGQLNYPHLFRILLTGIMSITFLQLLCRGNARFKAEALRVARGLESMMAPLGASLEQALSERQRAEAALAASRAADARVAKIKAQLEDAVSSMSQGLVMIDAQGGVVLCNPQTRLILDLPPDTLDPKALLVDGPELQAEGDKPDSSVSRTVNTRDGRHIEINSRRMQSGHTVHTYTDVTGWVGSNEKLRAAMQGMVIAQEQLQAEMQRARQESDMKLRFVTSVSHEIRTPLNGITGMVDLLSRSTLSEEQSAWISDLQTSTHQLRQLTDDILDLSRLKDSRFALTLAPFDLTEVVAKAVRAALGAAQNKGLKLELQMRDAPCPLIGDARRLTQILNNLIYNAIKFTACGSVRVHVEWRHANVADNLTEVVMSVADSGRGISQHLLGSIFEPFQQGDDSTNRDFGGTGLGLSLCRELSEAMDGSIRVASQPGEGSVFTVVLMLQRAAGDETGTDAPAVFPADYTAALAGKRILVVDDNRINRKLLSLWLAEAGAEVHMATDGAECLRAATAETFDAILMDVSMPVMNGLDATRAIRLLARSADEQQRPRAAVPVIGVTAMAGPDDLRRSLEAGMDAHLSKPLSRDQLLGTLRDMIAAHHWLRDIRPLDGA